MQSPSEEAGSVLGLLNCESTFLEKLGARRRFRQRTESVSGDEIREVRGDRKAAIFNPHHTNHLLIMPKPLSITFLGNFN